LSTANKTLFGMTLCGHLSRKPQRIPQGAGIKPRITRIEIRVIRGIRGQLLLTGVEGPTIGPSGSGFAFKDRLKNRTCGGHHTDTADDFVAQVLAEVSAAQ